MPNKRHDATTPQDLLYDAETPAPSHAERARTLVAACRHGTLCTLTREPAGYPYGSVVSLAVHDGAPLFLISALAEHTKNLTVDRRCSLLVAESTSPQAPRTSSGDILALGRVTILGQGRRVPAETTAAAREVYLAAHPQARSYVDFKDFALWQIDVESVRYIGGFGRMSWVPRGQWQQALPDPLCDAAPEIVAHMNEDHADALVAYCLAFSRAERVASATMVALDRYGFEMSAETPEGPRPIRVAFDAPLGSADQVRTQMIALLERARAKTSG